MEIGRGSCLQWHQADDNGLRGPVKSLVSFGCRSLLVFPASVTRNSYSVVFARVLKNTICYIQIKFTFKLFVKLSCCKR